MTAKKSFYGWKLAVVAWFLYGTQAVGFYGWGFYLPETLDELGLTRAQGGIVFGVSTLAGGLVSPFIGMSIGRFGLRATMTFGFMVSALGYLVTSQVQGMVGLALCYGVLAAGSHAFAAVLPTQALASIWFLRYRARVMAVLLSSAGILSPVVFALHAWVINEHSWRFGWVLIAAINVVLGCLALVFVRNAPEDVGQLRDGAASREELEAHSSETRGEDDWTAKEALRTRQFVMMLLCGLGYAVPWAVIGNHGRLHLQDSGMSIEVAATVLSTMVLVSTIGRLTGAFADFISPPRLLALALALEGSGTLVFLYARTQTSATIGAALIGLGFGMAFISQAATFSQFFGRRAFATTTGVRFMFGALFSASIPALTGWVFDTQGTYEPAFLGLAALTLAGSLTALILQAPERVVTRSKASDGGTLGEG